MTKKERLAELLEFFKNSSDKEYMFDDIHKRVVNEIKTEVDGNGEESNYIMQLKRIINIHFKEYLLAKRHKPENNHLLHFKFIMKNIIREVNAELES